MIVLHFGLIGLSVYLGIGLFLPTAGAQTMSNQDYIIKTQNVNIINNVTEDINSQEEPKVQKPDSPTSEGVNFKVRSGFENIAPSLPFSVTLSSDLADFGSLSPTNPIIRTVDLSVYSLSLYGYSVLASEDHSLKMSPEASGGSIPDTTCDNGDCNQENSAIWVNSLTYGFGYRCDNVAGIDCDNSFSDPNFYKSFPNASSFQLSQSVMAGVGSKNKSSRLSYKVNISGNQAQGTYTNIITYIAVPNF